MQHEDEDGDGRHSGGGGGGGGGHAHLYVTEFVGSFVTDFLVFAISAVGARAEAETLHSALQSNVGLLLASGGLPAGADPASWDAATLASLAPTPLPPMLLLAVGIACGYAVGLTIAPHTQLNPGFTVAMAMIGKKPWAAVPGIIASQLAGGVLACATLASLLAQVGCADLSDANAALGVAQLNQTGLTDAFVSVARCSDDRFKTGA